MKRRNLVFAGLLATVAALAGCVRPQPSTSSQEQTPSTSSQEIQQSTTPVAPVDKTQGIDKENKKIYIGNTAATSGGFAVVGRPFNIGLNAALAAYNNAGGFGDDHYQVELKHYDDGFDAATGLTYTKKLVEEDKVFALVGHFGTPTVSATVDYIIGKEVPMVYAATGVDALYNETAEGGEKAVMPVQPIYKTEGRVLLARALASTDGNLGLGGKKVGVISTTDEAGMGMLSGIQRQAEILGLGANDIKYVETNATAGTNHVTAVATLMASQCDVVIIAANQAPFAEIMNCFKTTGYDNVKVITSYVSANATLAGQLITSEVVTATREVYTTAWLDITSSTYSYKPEETNVYGTALWNCYKALVADTYPTYYDNGVPGFSEEYWKAAEDIFTYCCLDSTLVAESFTMSFDSYALAGYIAGSMFVEGLSRVDAENVELTWANYIAAMEKESYDMPMGGAIHLQNGNRVGISDLALNKYGTNAVTSAGELQPFSPITTLDDVVKGIK